MDNQQPYETDFDYIYKEGEVDTEGGKTLEELKAMIKSHNGSLVRFVKHGVGGGNPQFFVSFPSKAQFVKFFVELWGKEFYNEYFGCFYGEVE